jgi:hypothetical protein
MIRPPSGVISRVLDHAGVEHAPSSGGSSLYMLPLEHLPVVVLLAVVPLFAVAVAILAPRWPRAARLRDGYRARAPLHRLAAWLIAISAVVHLGLIGHHDGILGALMILDGLLLTGVVVLLLTGRPWRVPAAFILGGSLIAWWAVTLAGQAPDQLALLTKLVEVVALAIVLTPTAGARVRGWMASALVIVLVVVTDAAAWAGAFRQATDLGHMGGPSQPGMLMGSAPDRPATPAEIATANAVWQATVSALAPFRDPRIAAANGYEVDGVFGLDYHARNEAYQHDGRILDPARPEDLIYAAGPDGPVLLGAMFEMPEGAGPGPDIGGPLTVWHAHEHVCFGLIPLGMTGLLSPLGGCPVGSVDITRTPEMIHLWVADGAPVHWGELDDAWKADYVARAGTTTDR